MKPYLLIFGEGIDLRASVTLGTLTRTLFAFTIPL
jgi:hypothetical protein